MDVWKSKIQSKISWAEVIMVYRSKSYNVEEPLGFLKQRISQQRISQNILLSGSPQDATPLS